MSGDEKGYAEAVARLNADATALADRLDAGTVSDVEAVDEFRAIVKAAAELRIEDKLHSNGFNRVCEHAFVDRVLSGEGAGAARVEMWQSMAEAKEIAARDAERAEDSYRERLSRHGGF